MSDVKFNCPDCKQHIEAPEEILDTVVKCPVCGLEWEVVIDDVMAAEEDALRENIKAAHLKRFGSGRDCAEDLAAALMLKPERIATWLKQGGPMASKHIDKMKLLIQAMNNGRPLHMTWDASSDSEKLAELRRVGIQWVQVLGSGHAKRDCDACRTLEGKPMPIDEVTELPLPGCDALECCCIFIASEGSQEIGA
jgi:hypothetical protein